MSDGWVIAGKPQGALPEVGKVYEVRHSRKGTFTIRCTGLAGQWLNGVVTSGVAKAAMTYNVRYEGEEISIRDVHSYLIEVSP